MATLRAKALVSIELRQFDEALMLFNRAQGAATTLEQRMLVLPPLIRLLATCPDVKIRNVPRAMSLAEQLCSDTRWSEPASMDILASIYAAAGRIDEAISLGQRAAELARSQGQGELAKQIERHTAGYQAGPSAD